MAEEQVDTPREVEALMKSHHTKEQIEKAFAYAPRVLQQLREAGLLYSSLELFNDASGILWLDQPGKVTLDQYELACKLVRSDRRIFTRRDFIGIDFCCGLVLAAEKEEEEK